MLTRYLILLLSLVAPAVTVGQERFVPSSAILDQALELARSEKSDAAIQNLLKIHRSDTAYALTLVRLASLYNTLDQYDNVVKVCDEGLKLNSVYGLDFYNAKAKAYIDSEKYAKGRETLKEGLNKYPYSYIMMYNAAFSFYKENRYDSAYAYLEKSIRNNLYYGPSHYLLGCIALAQGHVTKGLMAWSFYIHLNPESEGSRQVLGLMENVSKNVPVIDEKERCKEFQDNKAFAYIDQLVTAQVALDKKYKTKVKFNAAIVRQLQLIIDQFKYDAGSKDFYMALYGAMVDAVKRTGNTEAFIYVMLTSTEDSKVLKWKKKNDSKIVTLVNAEEEAVAAVTRSKQVDLPNQKGLFNSWYSTQREIYALGNVKNNDFEKKTGYWRYFHPEHAYLMSEGRYNDNSMLDGEWTYYHENSVVSKKATFRNDTLQGPYFFYRDNGMISTKANYENGKAVGEITMFYHSGNKKEVFNFSNEYRNGPAKDYYCSGQLSDEYGYKDGNLDGPAIGYYANGKKRQEVNFKEGKLDGNYTYYHENGKVSVQAAYKDGNLIGKYVTYYDNGTIKDQGEYDSEGKPAGEWKGFHRNGKPEKSLTFVDGKNHGNIDYYDEDGVLHYTMAMHKGEQTGTTYFDKQGKVLFTASDKKGNFSVTGYDPDGVKILEGKYVSGLEEGEWKYFHATGNVKHTRVYKKGVLTGPTKNYNEAGDVIRSAYYEDGEFEGLFTEYHNNGQKSNEGYLRKGKEEGLWTRWYVNGTISLETYHMNGELNGYRTEYTTTGKKAQEEKYVDGLIYFTTSFDTTGKAHSYNDLSKGSGTWATTFANGKKRYEAPVSCHGITGAAKWFFDDGKVASEEVWLDGERQGAFRSVYANGKLRTEGIYEKNLRSGIWKWYNEEGKLTSTGKFINGERDSVWTYYHDNGQKDTETNFKNEDAHGTSRTYNLLGELVHEKHFRNDEIISYSYTGADGKMVAPINLNTLNDKLQAYHPNGKMSSLTEYKYGSKHGKEQAWYSNGQLFYENNFEKGMQTGQAVVYYPNGKKKEEATYVNNEYEGAAKYYREDGSLERIVMYVCGERNGKTEYYDAAGKITKTEFYWNDSIY